MIPQMECDWIKELLRRSNSSLLSVFLELNEAEEPEHNNNKTPETLFFLLQQTHRFKLLRLEISLLDGPSLGCLEPLVQLVSSHLEKPALALRTFSFWCNGFNDPDSELNLDRGHPVTLFPRDAPNLKRLHHRLSIDLRESVCPAFHNLSELHLTLLFDINFDRFLDLLEASPHLKVLLIKVDWDSLDVTTILESFNRNRTVCLPCLNKLALNVNHTVELIPLVFNHVIIPSDIGWDIVSPYFPDLMGSPHLHQFLSDAHFTSLCPVHRIHDTDFNECRVTCTNNQLDKNWVISRDIQDFAVTGILFMNILKSSRITHVTLEFEDASEDNAIFLRTFRMSRILNL